MTKQAKIWIGVGAAVALLAVLLGVVGVYLIWFRISDSEAMAKHKEYESAYRNLHRYSDEMDEFRSTRKRIDKSKYSESYDAMIVAYNNYSKNMNTVNSLARKYRRNWVELALPIHDEPGIDSTPSREEMYKLWDGINEFGPIRPAFHEK